MNRHSNGWLRQSSSVKPGFTVGKKLENLLKATNHLGYEVQEFQPGKGWISAVEEQVGCQPDGDTPIYKPLVVATQTIAAGLMDELKTFPGNERKEFRVYEALDFPVKKK